MSDQDRMEAIQNIVDRVSSWQDGAEEGTVEDELDRGAAEAGVDLTAAERRLLADAIQDRHGAVEAAEVLRARR
jgi:hypothetical protein